MCLVPTETAGNAAHPLAEHNRSRTGNVTQRIAPYLAAVLLTLLFYAPLASGSASLLMGDYFDYYAPNRWYAAQCLQAGRLPQWNPALFGGFPFLGDPQTGTFYPGNLLVSFLVRDAGRSCIMDWFMVMHVAFVALGGVFLARSLGIGAVGSVAVSVLVTHNGFMIMHLGHMSMVQVAAAGIWAMGCIARALRLGSLRYTGAAGLCLASVGLAGHPQMGLLVYGAAAVGGGLLALRKAYAARSGKVLLQCTGSMFLAYAIGIAGAMIQALPTRQLLNESRRIWGENTLDVALSGSLPLRQVYGLFFPNLYHPVVWRLPEQERWLPMTGFWGIPDMPWESMYHIGFCAFVLGFLGWMCCLRRPLAHALFFGALVLAMTAMGRTVGIYAFLYRHVPGFDNMRVPARVLWVAILAWALLAGLGVDSVCRGLSRGRLREAAKATLAVVLMAIGAGAICLLVAWLFSGNWSQALQLVLVSNPGFAAGKVRHVGDFLMDVQHQLAVIAVTVACCVVWLYCLMRRRLPSAALAATAVAAMYVELLVYGGHRNISTITGGQNDPVPPLYQALPETCAGRVLGMDVFSYEKPNYAMVAGYRNAGGYGGIMLKTLSPFLPYQTWSRGWRDQELCQNLFNVTHLLCRNRTIELNLGDKGTRALDAGWVQLTSDDLVRRDHLFWYVPPNLRPVRLHLVSAATDVTSQPTGLVMATLELNGADGEAATTWPIRLRHETAEWEEEAGAAADAKQADGRPSTAFTVPESWSGAPRGRFYTASFDIPHGTDARSVGLRTAPGRKATLNVSHLVIETSDAFHVLLGVEGLGHRQIAPRHRDWRVFERMGAFGDAWMVPVAEGITSSTEEIRLVYADAAFDPRKKVLLSGKGMAERAVERNAPHPQSFAGTTTVTQERPEHRTVLTGSNQRGWLVVSGTYCKGWKAYLDGSPIRLERANGWQQAVAVPEGKHRVELVYRTPGLHSGAWLSALGWTMGIVLLVRRRRGARYPVPS